MYLSSHVCRPRALVAGYTPEYTCARVYMHGRDAPGYACAGSACREYACAGAPGMCAGVCARVYAPGYACAAGEICAGVCMRRAPGPCGICMRRGMHAPGYVRRSRCMQAMAGAGMHAPGDALPPGIIYAPDATSRQNASPGAGAFMRREMHAAPGYNMRREYACAGNFAMCGQNQ
jgi:hypothetical protein